MKTKLIDSVRITHDINGNGRMVVHFLNFIKDSDRESHEVGELYNLALSRAHKIGGRKYTAKAYGGGIVFQCSSEDQLQENIYKLMNQ